MIYAKTTTQETQSQFQSLNITTDLHNYFLPFFPFPSSSSSSSTTLFLFPPNPNNFRKPLKGPSPCSSSSTHPSSTYGPRRSNRSPPSNSGIPKEAIGRGIPPFTASFDRAAAASRFLASISAFSSASIVLFMYFDTFLRLSVTFSSIAFPPLRARSISCWISHCSSLPSTSLLFSSQPNGPLPAVTLRALRDLLPLASRVDRTMHMPRDALESTLGGVPRDRP
mmetsp:Transcript_15939/g.19189  ORF Transcript_15939/g.19189 Transcript_15939/m.19189 type:complete len:224 (+) Transcript_15939:339-1010(+)